MRKFLLTAALLCACTFTLQSCLDGDNDKATATCAYFAVPDSIGLTDPANSHTHANKTILDTITQQLMTKLINKQDALTAGDGIKIENGVISLDIVDGNEVSY